MKTSLLGGAALAILGLAAAPLLAQTQTTATSSSTSSSYVQTSKIIGTKVKTAQGEEVGVVKDVVLDRSNGCMAYTVLSAGGTGTRVTGQAKLVAVPWSVYSVSPDMSYLTVSIERDRIYNAPVFEYSRISDTTYTTNVYSHFGVSAGVGISGATTTTTGATTQTQAGAYASPSASASVSASPAATPLPSASASVSASPSASAAATASAAVSASVSPTKSTRAKTGAPVSPRQKGDQMMQGTTGESPAETTGSPSSTKSSKKSTSAESSAESSASPSGKKSSHKKSSTEGAETSATPGGEQE
jgi:sporulation protein YlmC with PRC-barrel domain